MCGNGSVRGSYCFRENQEFYSKKAAIKSPFQLSTCQKKKVKVKLTAFNFQEPIF